MLSWSYRPRTPRVHYLYYSECQRAKCGVALEIANRTPPSQEADDVVYLKTTPSQDGEPISRRLNLEMAPPPQDGPPTYLEMTSSRDGSPTHLEMTPPCAISRWATHASRDDPISRWVRVAHLKSSSSRDVTGPSQDGKIILKWVNSS